MIWYHFSICLALFEAYFVCFCLHNVGVDEALIKETKDEEKKTTQQQLTWLFVYVDSKSDRFCVYVSVHVVRVLSV